MYKKFEQVITANRDQVGGPAVTFSGFKVLFNASASEILQREEISRVDILIDREAGKFAFAKSNDGAAIKWRAKKQAVIYAGKFIKEIGGKGRSEALLWNQEISGLEGLYSALL